MILIFWEIELSNPKLKKILQDGICKDWKTKIVLLLYGVYY